MHIIKSIFVFQAISEHTALDRFPSFRAHSNLLGYEIVWTFPGARNYAYVADRVKSNANLRGKRGFPKTRITNVRTVFRYFRLFRSYSTHTAIAALQKNVINSVTVQAQSRVATILIASTMKLLKTAWWICGSCKTADQNSKTNLCRGSCNDYAIDSAIYRDYNYNFGVGIIFNKSDIPRAPRN